MKLYKYNREKAFYYANKWALKRNPLFADFTEMGGDCTNFVSQCLFAGTCAMNFTKNTGWYYKSLDNRTAAWSGVSFLYEFLLTNQGKGPFGIESEISKLEVGDVIFMGYKEQASFLHSVVVTGNSLYGIVVCTHTEDYYNRPLITYDFDLIKGVHINGYRADEEKCDCFLQLFNGTSIKCKNVE